MLIYDPPNTRYTNYLSGHTSEVVNFHCFCWGDAIIRSEDNLEFAGTWGDVVSSSVLITESVTANANWLFPAWDKERNVFANNWFTEDDSIENVTDSSIWGFPHRFKVEFFNTVFIWCDGCTFDSNIMLKSSICGVDSDCSVRISNTYFWP